MHVVVFLSVHVPKVDTQRRSTKQRYAENSQFPSRAHFCGSGDNLLFCQHLLDQLGTRVSHTKVARSRLLDLNDILLQCSFRYYPSLRWLMTQDSGPLPCSASALTWVLPWVFPSLPLPISVGVELTFILFSAWQRHPAWDIRSQNWSFASV